MPSTISYTFTEGSVSNTTSEVLADNSNRKFAKFINDSDTVMYLRVGENSVANEGIRLSATGGEYTMSPKHGNLSTREVDAIVGSGSGKVLLVIEGT